MIPPQNQNNSINQLRGIYVYTSHDFYEYLKAHAENAIRMFGAFATYFKHEGIHVNWWGGEGVVFANNF